MQERPQSRIRKLPRYSARASLEVDDELHEGRVVAHSGEVAHVGSLSVRKAARRTPPFASVSRDIRVMRMGALRLPVGIALNNSTARRLML